MTKTITLNRRSFGIGAAGLALAGLVPQSAFAQETRSVTTALGTYDIPADPQRVLCVDSRLDIEPAVALGLNIVGHAYDKVEPWVPADPNWKFVGEVPDLEQVLALDPDLIICTDVGDRDSEYWPINRLKDVAPVLPPPYVLPWKEILAQIGVWTGREGAADAMLAEYDALIADIKQRRAEQIASKTIAVVQPWSDGTIFLQAELSLLQPQIMADLGAKTIPVVEGNIVSAENFSDVLGGVDGILLVLHTEGGLEPVAQQQTWTRLPAVAAGKVIGRVGNTNFGGIYTAMHVAKLFDELYGTLA
ncbi:ABC transporter substrate-binding protein [Devosia sp. 2618]|uniref:ABC transporter substrate-binding protein n=1 Tax=Devosia sp. 2618 TaxID=3156454 RepID=UPI00339A25AF